MAKQAEPVYDRFMRKWRLDPRTECWRWIDALDVYGYGRLQIAKRARKAHRVSLQLFGPSVPENSLVCHHCDNRDCVNPWHLYVGTPATNLADCIRRGRFRPGRKPSPGSLNGRALLREQEAVALKVEALRGASSRELSVRYGLCMSATRRLINGTAWKHLPSSLDELVFYLEVLSDARTN